MEYLKPIVGGNPGKDLFSGINTDWSRIKGGEIVGRQLKEIQQNFKPLAPWESVPALVQLHKQIQQLPENPYKSAKLAELEEIILASTGLFAEASTAEVGAAPNTNVAIKLEVANRAPVAVKLQKVTAPDLNWDTAISKTLVANQPLILQEKIRIPAHMRPSQPYWLVEAPGKGMFKLDNIELTGTAENKAPINLQLLLSVEGQEISLKVPLVHKLVDPAYGEKYQPFVITPPMMVTPLQDQLIFSTDQPQELTVRVRGGREAVKGTLSLSMPANWQSEPASIPVESLRKGEERTYVFKIIPPKKAATGTIGVVARVDDAAYKRGYETISAPHFPVQTLFPEAAVGVVRLDLKRAGDRIGYIMGAGDALPVNLTQVGYNVNLLDPASITPQQLAQYDAVVLGVRAFNTQEALRHTKGVLEAYARAGGVVVIQYNTTHELVTPDITPYPLRLSRNRITDEEAPVRLLAPKHPALSYPNKITEKDFEGWVQERGLYFPESWSSEWQPLLSSHDAGEKPLEGGLLVAPVGEGYYVYGAYSWFRQLPAGVPGAYRLMANLLALGKKQPK